MTFGLVEPGDGFAGFGLVEPAGGLVTLAVEFGELVPGPFDEKGASPFEIAGVLLFHIIAATPRPATSTTRIIKNGRYRFIQIKNVPRRAAFRDRRHLPRESTHAAVPATR